MGLMVNRDADLLIWTRIFRV